MLKEINAAIFAGAIWGIAEATIGWVLHLAHVPHISLWMAPIVLACLALAYSTTGRASSALYAAVVAALIKCTDLLMPVSVPLYYVLNPASYILLEGVVGALILKVLNMKKFPRLNWAFSTRLSVATLIVAVAINVAIFMFR